MSEDIPCSTSLSSPPEGEWAFAFGKFCKAAKEFLSVNNVEYKEIDVSKSAEKEQVLIKLSGTRIVPTFVFKNKRFFLTSVDKVFIGFEQNKEEIEGILLKK